MRDYGMSLASIERNYGCVAEYNRVMLEESHIDNEAEDRWKKTISNNLSVMKEHDKDKSSVYFADDCIGCNNYHYVGPTSPDDDVEHGWCDACPSKCKVSKWQGKA